MGLCLSCIVGDSSQDDGSNERMALLPDQSTADDAHSLQAQLRDAKLMAVLNATNDRLVDHEEIPDVRVVQPQEQPPIDPEVLKTVSQIKF